MAFSSFDQHPAGEPVGGDPEGRRVRHDVLDESFAEDGAVLPDLHEGTAEVLPGVMAVGGHEGAFRSAVRVRDARWCIRARPG
ncbi:hypothetical protein ACQR35_10700 [Pseudarthrobacter sp. J1738]|uniref:hypothetical protein n=1 Tax=Pseudarthrobacter sp. J1738 TaxID=3420446 RepID=UPI003D2B4A93